MGSKLETTSLSCISGGLLQSCMDEKIKQSAHPSFLDFTQKLPCKPSIYCHQIHMQANGWGFSLMVNILAGVVFTDHISYHWSIFSQASWDPYGSVQPGGCTPFSAMSELRSPKPSLPEGSACSQKRWFADLSLSTPLLSFMEINILETSICNPTWEWTVCIFRYWE